MEDRCERNSCVCGYHIYMSTWDAIIGKELPCERETGNERDRYAVAVKKDRMIIGHSFTTQDISAMFTIPEKKEQNNLSCDGIQEVFLGLTSRRPRNTLCFSF